MAGISIPLNCADRGLLALSSIDEWMHGHIILKVSGDLDSSLLGGAILRALGAHPTLRSKLYTRRMRLFRRIEEAKLENMFNCVELTEPPESGPLPSAELDESYNRVLSECVNRRFDLTREYPARAVLVKRSRGECHLVFSMEHSSADARGFFPFIRDVIRVYNGEEPPQPPVLEDRSQVRKDELIEFALRRRKTTKGFYRKNLSSLFNRFLVEPLNPPSRIFHDRKGPPSGIGYCVGALDRAETASIRSRAKSAGATLNDLLLAACFRVVEIWNTRHGKRSGKIRIMVPVDVGEPGAGHVTSNQVSWISPSTMPGERADPVKLLHRVSEDVAAKMREGIPFSIIYWLRYSSQPMVLAKAVARFLVLTRVYIDSTLLSNIGVIWPKAWGEPIVGGHRIDDIVVVPPVVTPQRLGMVPYSFDDRLHVGLAYKAALFSREKAQSFLDLYLDEIRRYSAILETA